MVLNNDKSINNCPFCGSDDVGHAYTATRVFIYCGSCSASGPQQRYSCNESLAPAEDLAVDKWNCSGGAFNHE